MNVCFLIFPYSAQVNYNQLSRLVGVVLARLVWCTRCWEARRLPAATKQHHLLADRWVKEELDDVPDTPAKDVGWKDERPRHRLWEVVGQA